MKKLFITLTIVCVLWIGALESRDFTSYAPVFSKTITDSTIVNVYVLYPDIRGTWYVSETLPTKTVSSAYARGTRFRIPKSVGLVIEPTTVSGATDSLLHYMTPLVWDAKDEVFVSIPQDIHYLRFSGNDYAHTDSLYLDWTSAKEYTNVFNTWAGDIGAAENAIFPYPGFVLHVRFVDAGGGSLTWDLTVNGVFED